MICTALFLGAAFVLSLVCALTALVDAWRGFTRRRASRDFDNHGTE